MKKIISLVTIVMFAFLIMGCETVNEYKGAATGEGSILNERKWVSTFRETPNSEIYLNK